MALLTFTSNPSVINHFEQLQLFCEEQNLELRLTRIRSLNEFVHFCTITRLRGDAKLEVQGRGGSLFEALQDAMKKMDAALGA